MSQPQRRRFWRDNSLSLVLGTLFLVFWLGQTLTGWHDENHIRARTGHGPQSLTEYVLSGSFVEATAENFESEFLQAFMYVWLTAWLFQRGSAESKDPDKKEEEVDRKPDPTKKDAPAVVRRGGFALWLYERSLGLVFIAFFGASFVAHLIGGAAAFNDEAQQFGEPTMSVGRYLFSARFWFQSFQNWQSEFLALFCMVVLSIHLRHRGSPESKPVDAPHAQTG